MARAGGRAGGRAIDPVGVTSVIKSEVDRLPTIAQQQHESYGRCHYCCNRIVRVVKYVNVSLRNVIETSLRQKRFCEKDCVIQVLYILRGNQGPSNRVQRRRRRYSRSGGVAASHSRRQRRLRFLGSQYLWPKHRWLTATRPKFPAFSLFKTHLQFTYILPILPILSFSHATRTANKMRNLINRYGVVIYAKTMFFEKDNNDKCLSTREPPKKIVYKIIRFLQ